MRRAKRREREVARICPEIRRPPSRTRSLLAAAIRGAPPRAWPKLSGSLAVAEEPHPFGIITQIDMQATLKAKLGVDSRPYRILGACNPGFAKKALELEPRVGLLLPCNVVLYERDDARAMLGVIDPMQQLGATGGLVEIAREIGEKLARVAEKVDA